jgi:hypothetical protein
MPFSTEEIQVFLAELPEDQRATASDLLSTPDKLSKYISAHQEANDEAKTYRQSVKMMMAQAGFDLTKAELTKLIEYYDYINEGGEFHEERFIESLEKEGLRQALASGEDTPEELGLIEYEDGTLKVDMNDGEVYTDDEGYLVDGNGDYVDEDGELVDEPIHMSEVDSEGYNSQLAEKEAELLRKEQEFEQRQARVELESRLIRQGVDPEAVAEFANIYKPPTADDGGELTDEQIKSHIDNYKSNPRYTGFFKDAGYTAVTTDHSRITQGSTATGYEQAKQTGDIQAMLANNAKYVKPEITGNNQQ